MTFLVDTQQPRRRAWALSAAGHDVIHSSELPDGNQTTDAEIFRVADADERVVAATEATGRVGL